LSGSGFDATFWTMLHRGRSRPVTAARLALFWLFFCLPPAIVQSAEDAALVSLTPIEVDPKRPERRSFGTLTLLSAFQLESKDKRFGGLSGLSIGADGKLYAISDRGYWLSAKIQTDSNGILVSLTDWQIASMLTPSKKPVSGVLRDAEALAVVPDGSFLVAFEGRHRIWRYSPPPHTFESIPVPMEIPRAVTRAPGNAGIEALTVLPDGRFLALTEGYKNPDGSFKGWLIDNGGWAELSYVPAAGFRVTDCAALDNGDVLVLERRYVPLGILSARITLVKGNDLLAGAKLAGKELLRLEAPIAAENYEAMAVQQTAKGTMILIASDDNYSPFQQTVLLQFLLPNTSR
jgi:hypothetical protein